jgi:ribonuclease HI
MWERGGDRASCSCAMHKISLSMRHEMRRHWFLLDEKQFRCTGPDWLLLLLSSVDADGKANILLLFWRAWHLVKGTSSIIGSAKFLTSYKESLQLVNQKPHNLIDVKGKITEGTRALESKSGYNQLQSGTRVRWELPPHGWVKLNTDAGYCPRSGLASLGVVVRDAEGKVLLTAWKVLRRCDSAEEAEAEACLEGLRLLVEWIKQPSYLESDCATLVHALVGNEETRSRWAGILSEIHAVKALLPGNQLRHVRREENGVAHWIAKKALRGEECMVLRYDMPDGIRKLVEAEAAGTDNPPIPCNPVMT